jgi:hypothetical protein
MQNYVKTSMSNYATENILLNKYFVSTQNKNRTPQYKPHLT